jgi:hypothetical protein
MTMGFRALARVGWVWLLGACSSTTEPAPAPPQPNQGAAWPTGAEQCSALIGKINAGVAYVEAAAGTAASQKQNELAAMAAALDNVATDLENMPFADDELLRLGGFYVGVLRLQAKTTRELDAALVAGDKAVVERKQADLASLEAQETAIVGDLNRLCGATM